MKQREKKESGMILVGFADSSASNTKKTPTYVLLWMTGCRWRQWVEEVDRVCKCVCEWERGWMEESHLFPSVLITGWADLKDCGICDSAGRWWEVWHGCAATLQCLRAHGGKNEVSIVADVQEAVELGDGDPLKCVSFNFFVCFFRGLKYTWK